MAAAIVQCVAGDAGAGSTTLNITLSSTTSGNAIIVLIGPEERAVTGVTDNKGGGSSTYSEVAGTVNQSAAPGCWYTLDCASGITQVTVTGASQPYIAFAIEVSGLVLSGAEDKHAWNTSQAASTTWTSTATSALAQGNEFCLGVVCSRSGSSQSFTGDSPWTAITGTNVTAGHHGNATDGDDLFVCYQSVTATTAITASGTCASSTVNGGTVTFREQAPGFMFGGLIQ